MLNKMFTECLERCRPLCGTWISHPPSPWMKTLLIRNLQKERNVLRAGAHKPNADDSLWTAFCLGRKKLKYAIQSAWKTFIEKALSSNKSREVWRVIHRILKPIPRPLHMDPDKLNTYFTTTAERTLGSSTVPLDDLTCIINNLPYINPPDASSFSLRLVAHGEVLKCMKSLCSDCSTGADNIPARFVKLIAEHFTGHLMGIIDNCIRNSYFPRLWKTASVSLIPKLDTPVSSDQFYPRSILPVLSNVFKKLLAAQMSDFVKKASLLHDHVSSFCKGHSTTTALLGIRDAIQQAIKKGDVSLMVLADFSKVFDTMCFKTTIHKFHKLGFSKTFLKWILSYLSDRSQFVQIEDKSSSYMSTKFGIP